MGFPWPGLTQMGDDVNTLIAEFVLNTGPKRPR